MTTGCGASSELTKSRKEEEEEEEEAPAHTHTHTYQASLVEHAKLVSQVPEVSQEWCEVCAL